MSALEIAGWVQGIVVIVLIVAGGACLGQVVNRMSNYQRMLDRSRRRRP